MILERTTRIEYDFSMRFFRVGVFKCGDQVPSGTKDDYGRCQTFNGTGIVVATETDYVRPHEPARDVPETIYVQIHQRITA